MAFVVLASTLQNNRLKEQGQASKPPSTKESWKGWSDRLEKQKWMMMRHCSKLMWWDKRTYRHQQPHERCRQSSQASPRPQKWGLWSQRSRYSLCENDDTSLEKRETNLIGGTGIKAETLYSQVNVDSCFSNWFSIVQRLKFRQFFLSYIIQISYPVKTSINCSGGFQTKKIAIPSSIGSNLQVWTTKPTSHSRPFCPIRLHQKQIWRFSRLHSRDLH